MGTVYTITELLAIRRKCELPAMSAVYDAADNKLDNRVSTYLGVYRRYLKLLGDGPEAFRLKFKPESKIVMKYDYASSNKEFKRRWVKSHGTSAGLASLPRIPVRVFSVRVRFLEEYFRTVERTEKLLTKLLNRLGRARVPRGPPEYATSASPSRSAIPAKGNPRNRVRPFKRDRKRAVKLVTDSQDENYQYLRVIGGPTVRFDGTRPPPKKEWTKYWYFYRKYGRWRPSEHHPYGDEGEKLPIVADSGLVYPHG